MNKCACHEIDISTYLDGELSPELSNIIEKHLQTCSKCKEALHQMQSLSKSIQELPRPLISSSITMKVLDLLQKEKNGEIFFVNLFKLWGILSLCAIGIILVSFGSILFNLVYVFFKNLLIVLNSIVKLSQQIPMAPPNLIFAAIFITIGILSLYGFGYLYFTIFKKELVS